LIEIVGSVDYPVPSMQLNFTNGIRVSSYLNIILILNFSDPLRKERSVWWDYREHASKLEVEGASEDYCEEELLHVSRKGRGRENSEDA